MADRRDKAAMNGKYGRRLKEERDKAEAMDRRRQRQIKLQGERIEALRDLVLSLAVEVRAIEQKHPEYTARSVDQIVADAQARVEFDS